MSLGAERELSFLHATKGALAYFPQTNGMAFSFGRDVNIHWKHGVSGRERDRSHRTHRWGDPLCDIIARMAFNLFS